MRQAAYLNDKAGLESYREEFYLPHFVDDDGLRVYEARGDNYSLAGSFSAYQVDGDSVVGRWDGVRRWFARIRDRLRRWFFNFIGRPPWEGMRTQKQSFSGLGHGHLLAITYASKC